MHVIRAEEAQAQMATNVHGTPVDISGPNDDGHPSADEPIALR